MASTPFIAAVYAPMYLATLYAYASSVTLATSFPSSAAALRSLKSLEIPPDIPSTPDFLLRILSISLIVRFSWLHKNSRIAGSRSPERVPMISPSRGVSPIDVSTHLPPIEAEIEAPLPR